MSRPKDELLRCHTPIGPAPQAPCESPTRRGAFVPLAKAPHHRDPATAAQADPAAQRTALPHLPGRQHSRHTQPSQPPSSRSIERWHREPQDHQCDPAVAATEPSQQQASHHKPRSYQRHPAFAARQPSQHPAPGPAPASRSHQCHPTAAATQPSQHSAPHLRAAATNAIRPASRSSTDCPHPEAAQPPMPPSRRSTEASALTRPPTPPGRRSTEPRTDKPRSHQSHLVAAASQGPASHQAAQSSQPRNAPCPCCRQAAALIKPRSRQCTQPPSKALAAHQNRATTKPCRSSPASHSRSCNAPSHPDT
jgi:hypothetical protein